MNGTALIIAGSRWHNAAPGGNPIVQLVADARLHAEPDEQAEGHEERHACTQLMNRCDSRLHAAVMNGTHVHPRFELLGGDGYMLNVFGIADRIKLQAPKPIPSLQAPANAFA